MPSQYAFAVLLPQPVLSQAGLLYPQSVRRMSLSAQPSSLCQPQREKKKTDSQAKVQGHCVQLGTAQEPLVEGYGTETQFLCPACFHAFSQRV